MPHSKSQWSGSPSIKGSSEAMQMILLNINIIGLEFIWSLETTYCTPYLLSLGLSKSKTSLVFLAGPLSGLLMQPIVGAIADRSTSKYGRRRPFMFWGSIIASICFLLLGWTKEVVAHFVSGDENVKSVAIAVAVLMIYVVDFAINAVQACGRSLIVDVLPVSRQQAGAAWATRVGGFGHLLCFGVGALDLVSLLPAWLGGDTQFKKVTTISVAMNLIAVAITCYSVNERVLISSPDHGTSVWGILPSIWHRMFNLPKRVQAICWVQFWSWIGWFPFLFYSSTWVGETYYRHEHKADPSEDNHDALGNIGRLGSWAMVLFSMVTFAAAIIFPYLIKSTHTGSKGEDRYTPRPPPFLPKGIQNIIEAVNQIPKPSLVTAWQLAHLTFALIMIWAPVVKSLAAATLVVALCGLPWQIGGWAPLAEIGIEINRLATGSANHIASEGESAILISGGYQAVRHSLDEDGIELSPRRRSSSILRVSHPELEKDDDASTGELAGVYLGVLNVYTTLPQFVGTFISWIVFSIFEPDRSGLTEEHPKHHHYLDLDVSGINGISVCFFIGAICAVVAAEATRRLKKIS